jgi:hypothetical protein
MTEAKQEEVRDAMHALLGETAPERKLFAVSGAGSALQPALIDARVDRQGSKMCQLLETYFLLSVALSAFFLGCDQSQTQGNRSHTAPRQIPIPTAVVAASAVAAPSPLTPPPTSKEVDEPAEQAKAQARGRMAQPRIGRHRLVLDELADVAPAGPSAATSVGVLMVTRDGAMLLARLSPANPTTSAPTGTPVSPLDVKPEELVGLDHGPAVSAGYAYFVLGGHLVRRKLPNGPMENLADDARAYTRVALPDLPMPKEPTIVAYIARHPTAQAALIARLWVEGQGSVTLTPDGSTGNSVALARTNDGYTAMSIESRTGMSPVHARRISFDAGKIRLGSDVVPWVAGSAQPLTEIRAIGDPSSVWALLPIERDATRFGLARIDLGLLPQMGAEVHWRDYPNGIEPAVVTAGYLCDRPVVLYARPATAEPHATQELHLASIEPDGLGASTVVATSRAFSDASMAALDGGALLVYVADRRTWTRRLRCSKP